MHACVLAIQAQFSRACALVHAEAHTGQRARIAGAAGVTDAVDEAEAQAEAQAEACVVNGLTENKFFTGLPDHIIGVGRSRSLAVAVSPG